MVIFFLGGLAAARVWVGVGAAAAPAFGDSLGSDPAGSRCFDGATVPSYLYELQPAASSRMSSSSSDSDASGPGPGPGSGSGGGGVGSDESAFCCVGASFRASGGLFPAASAFAFTSAATRSGSDSDAAGGFWFSS